MKNRYLFCAVIFMIEIMFTTCVTTSASYDSVDTDEPRVYTRWTVEFDKEVYSLNDKMNMTIYFGGEKLQHNENATIYFHDLYNGFATCGVVDNLVFKENATSIKIENIPLSKLTLYKSPVVQKALEEKGEYIATIAIELDFDHIPLELIDGLCQVIVRK